MGRPNVALRKVWRHLGTPDDSFATNLFQFCDNISGKKDVLAFLTGIRGQGASKQSWASPFAISNLRSGFHFIVQPEARRKHGICIFGRAQPFKMHDPRKCRDLANAGTFTENKPYRLAF
jgi:hypothetical protein